ncbi:unnamed protein product [Rotaria sordida]|uniref:Uncharacterized protein n=1 Tax=Rotaria sordida TaxID=392033 RepID=A0A819V5X0_9BILA|nr:unnamed protein product [Rotaria sordida]CAF1156653.1 unnamed protein product [Rotaria sordida]CAF3726665.1 unnamed protein product [Rotaria sordida]CAF4092307.1 unnamed protein product [Rotaria sordida]CAF4102816.1 unnamed protein product [Rotaria sordida]
MLSNINFWEYLTAIIFYFLLLIKPISNQGIACYKCMTIDANNDSCQDPFSSLLNPIHNNCQATSVGKDGTFSARFCVKISGRVTSIDGGANASYLNTIFYYRTCIVDNIMESTKSLETSGSFRLKGFQDMSGSIRLQGHISLCTHDGCNHARTLCSSLLIIILDLLLIIYVSRFS